MKISTIVIIVLVVAVLGLGAYFLSQEQANKSDSMMQKEDAMTKEDSGDAMMEKEDSTMAKDDAMMKSDSRYIPYTPEVFNTTADKKRVLFFYANWCPTCKPANENFTANVERIPEDVVLIRVNYNDPDTETGEKALAQKYGITYQHTFVQIDESGNVVKKWNGGQIDELLANIQ